MTAGWPVRGRNRVAEFLGVKWCGEHLNRSQNAEQEDGVPTARLRTP